MRLVLLISLINSFSSLLAASKGATGNIKNYQITLTLIGALHLPFAWLAFELGGSPEYSMYVYLVCRSINLSITRYNREVLVKCAAVLMVSSAVPVTMHIMLEQSILTTLSVVTISVIGVGLSTFFIGLTSTERNAVLKPILSRFKNK